MDNKTCIHLVQSDELIRNALRSLVIQCRELIAKSNGKFVLEHCYREGNRAADWLANKGIDGTHVTKIRLNPPLELCNIVRDDIIGVSLPRILNS